MPSATGVLSKPARQTSEVFGEATRVCNPAWSRAELVCFLQAIELGRLLSTSPLPILVHVGGNATHVSCFEGIARLCQMLHPRSEGGDICHNLLTECVDLELGRETLAQRRDSARRPSPNRRGSSNGTKA